MKCPKCVSVELVERQIRGKKLQVRYCPECSGIWLYGGELEQIIPDAVRDFSVPKNASKANLHCPACQIMLYNFEYPQTLVRVEMCGKCKGIWFDGKHEIQEIYLVRKNVKQTAPDAEDKIPGIKGFLIRRINVAIDDLWAIYP